MRRFIALLAVLALTSCSRQPAAIPVSSSPGTPDQHIASAESTVVRFSDALAAGDSATVTALAGQHFALVEDGRTYNATEAIASVREALAAGPLSRTTADLRTHLHGRVAWTHYTVTVTAGKGASTSKRLETAVVVRQDDERWNIVLMSSMPAAAK